MVHSFKTFNFLPIRDEYAEDEERKEAKGESISDLFCAIEKKKKKKKKNMGHGFSCVLPLERERRKRGDSLKEALSLRSSINRCSRSSSRHSSSLGRSSNRRGINGMKKASYAEEEGEDEDDDDDDEEEFVQKQQQALAMILLQQQLRFERSTSVRTRRSTTPKHGSSSSAFITTTTATTTANANNTNNAIARSSSVRVRHPDDPVLQPHELISTLKVWLELSTLSVNKFLIQNLHGKAFENI